MEDPVPLKIVGLPPYSQVTHPYWFGHPYSKQTCPWLKGLPPLMATVPEEDHLPQVNGGSKDRHGNYRRAKGRQARSPKLRSKTFPGIAWAMDRQFGGVCE